MKAEEKTDFEELSGMDFINLLKTLKEKNKDNYNLILQGGASMKFAIYKLFQLARKEERKPTLWKEMIVVQLFKGKGSCSEFQNQQYIHTKNEIPKAFEHIGMAKAKAT